MLGPLLPGASTLVAMLLVTPMRGRSSPGALRRASSGRSSVWRRLEQPLQLRRRTFEQWVRSRWTRSISLNSDRELEIPHHDHAHGWIRGRELPADTLGRGCLLDVVDSAGR